MQFNEQVLTALEVLRNFAENDFERHRIDVLEKDLTAPPKAEVIDDKYQKFNGVIYHQSTPYHHFNNIHLYVWNYYTGIEVPPGYDIHHKDVNAANNDISNLQMLSKADHRKIHNELRKLKRQEFICKNCGKKFLAINTGKVKFCSKKCYHRYDLEHRPKVTKICVYCGKEFIVDTHNAKHQKCCSHSCGAKLARRTKKLNSRQDSDEPQLS